MPLKNIVVFVSGKGSNANNIIKHFEPFTNYGVNGVFSSKPNKELSDFSKSHGIKFYLFNKGITFADLLHKLKENNIHLVVLAGFLKKIPLKLIKSFEYNIINIHPALLPKYGGKGMYGIFVHQEVIKSKEKITGISIHIVEGEYDSGPIIAQIKVPISIDETAESLSKKISNIEHKFYVKTIQQIIKGGIELKSYYK